MNALQYSKDTITCDDGYVLNTLLYRPPHYSVHIIFVLGKNECLYKYQELAEKLYLQHYAITIYDHRGQGTNEKILNNDSCHIEKFENYTSDLHNIIMHYNLKVNTFLCAISMGGLITLNYIKNIFPKYKTPNIKGIILISPFLGTKHIIPEQILKFLITIKSLIQGNKNYLKHNDYFKERIFGLNANTHDINQHLRYKKIHKQYPNTTRGGVTNGWLFENLKAILNVRKKWNIDLPSIFLLAENDNIVSTQKSLKFISNHQLDTVKAKLHIFSNCYHDILIETDNIRLEALKKIIEFIEYEKE